ncbi:hypothetical protein M8494_12580 [Serratia ureilytica]
MDRNCGFPYAGTYIGPENIIKNVHRAWQRVARLPRRCRPLLRRRRQCDRARFITAPTGPPAKSQRLFCACYTLRGGKIGEVPLQIVDSAKVPEAMQP